MMFLFKMIAEDNFKILCNLATDILGLPKNSLAYKSRKEKYALPRTIVSVVSRMIDETHPTIIAKVLNRDRVAVYHYEKYHESNYRTYPKYRDVFNTIFNAYYNFKGQKKVFITLSQLKKHLQNNGVLNSKTHQTTIRVTSGKVQADVKVSYRDFYEMLEKCKFAMQDCNYNLEII